MKLNKKYQPKYLPNSYKKEKSDFLFPIFFPDYQKIDGKAMAHYFSQALEQKRSSKRIGTEPAPMLITGVATRWFSQLLLGKSGLPFSAKMQRLATHHEKFLKKGVPLLSQIFSEQELATYNFNITDDVVQSFLPFLSEKNLRKQSQELVWRDVSSQTIVHPDDIIWKEEKQIQLEIKCFVETKNDVFPLIIDDPLLLFSDVGVVVHENDKRYKKHIGKKIIIPVINKSIPIFGEENIDTIKDNGIQRLNPLFSPQSLERVKEYGLSIDEEYIDDQGLFSEKVANFWGKSVFEFTENIIETLSTIWNLVSQQEIKKQVPYSQETGHRLIRKVVSTVVLDFSDLKEEFFAWIEEFFPQMKSFFENEEVFKILIENRNPYAQKLSFLADDCLRLFSLKDYQSQLPTPFSAFLLDQIRKGVLSYRFTVDELIDVLLLSSEEQRRGHDSQTSFSSQELISTYKKLKSESEMGEDFLEKLFWELDHLDWIQRKERMIVFLPEVLWWTKKLLTVACDDSFLRALALVVGDCHFVLQTSSFGSEFLVWLLFLMFIARKEHQITFFSFQDSFQERISFPEKVLKLVEIYGRETIRLLEAKHQQCDEGCLKQNFEYLKHFWNLFKTLYDQGVFDQKVPETLRIGGKEFWIYSQWKKLESSLWQSDPWTWAFIENLQLLQDFTREQFSWYLALIKQEKNSESWLIAGQIFLWIMRILDPIIPEFALRVREFLKEKKFPLLENGQILWVKDYKVYLLFDIIKGVSVKKLELKLKKHMPIQLCIQANSDILHLISLYESSFNMLFKTKGIQYLTANESFPSEFETFAILDMTIGIKLFSLTKEEDVLVGLEKAYKEKAEHIEYLRSTLMALSLNPLWDPTRIGEKEEELEKLKSELQQLEIKIQKLKIGKK